MGAINLNDSEEFIKEFKIFNDGGAGVAENVKARIERKTSGDDKKPDYKLIAADALGEVNEGFYYQEAESEGFTKYQAQRLIMLARGVLGKDVVFPVWNNPKEVLDGVMGMVGPRLNGSLYRVAVCYGTTKKPSQYLGFKSFGSFIQPMSVPNTLSLGRSDSVTRAIPAPATPASTLISNMNVPEGKNLEWLEDKK